MFCTNCGESHNDAANFCSKCGKRLRPESYARSETFTGATNAAPERKLIRPIDDKWIAGVCSAFARYLNVDLALVRILWLSAVIVFGTGILAYLICWFIIPREQPAAFSPQSA
jgi:phage shock protein C